MQIGPVHVKRYWLIVAFTAMAVMGAYGIWRVDDATNQNRALLCSIADLISRSPITQLPNESDEQFRHRLGVYHDFVSNVSVQSGTDCGADVSTRLRRHLKHAQHLRHSIPAPDRRGQRGDHSQEDIAAPASGAGGGAGASSVTPSSQSPTQGARAEPPGVVTTTSAEPSTSTTTQVQTTTQTTTATTPGGGGKPPGNVCVPVIRRCIDAPGLPPGTMIWLRPGVDLSGLAG